MIFGGKRLGIYFLETGAVARGSKVVYDRELSAFSQLKKGMLNWDLIFKDADWFHWTGIIPAISKGATEVLIEALENAEKRGITVSCDVNYRSKLWKAGNKASLVMPDLIAKTDILIANEFDAEKVLCVNTGLPEDCEYSNTTFKQISEKLIEKYPRIKKVITSRRGTINANYNRLVGIIFDGKNVLESPIYEITHIVDRVGGGDSLMAGLIYGFYKFPENNQRIIDFAVAASFIKHTVLGDINMTSVSEVEKVMRGETGGQIDW
nr:sugar kinase [uncultured Marinifilum sp.]